MRFASARVGWLFGDGLLATTDGGRRWRAIPAPGNVLDLETGDGGAYAVVLTCANQNDCQTAHLYRVGARGLARIGPRRALLPSSLVVRGASVYLLAWRRSGIGSTLWASHDRGRSWRRLRAPCRFSGAESGALAAWSPDGLALACGSQPATDMQTKTFYASSDGGARWRPVGRLAFGLGFVQWLAAKSPTHWALAEGRAPEGILLSLDGGRRWRQARFARPNRLVGGWSYVALLGAGHAVAVPWDLNGGVLALSVDGGRRWREVL